MLPISTECILFSVKYVRREASKIEGNKAKLPSILSTKKKAYTTAVVTEILRNGFV